MRVELDRSRSVKVPDGTLTAALRPQAVTERSTIEQIAAIDRKRGFRSWKRPNLERRTSDGVAGRVNRKQRRRVTAIPHRIVLRHRSIWR